MMQENDETIFDLEMQQPRPSHEEATNNHGAIRRFRTAILVVRYRQMFLDGISVPVISRVDSSKSSSLDQQHEKQICNAPKYSKIQAASSEHHITIDQTATHSQLEYLSKIVRQRNLQTLDEEFGGLVGAKIALGTDLDKGISDEEALNRKNSLSLCLAHTRTFVHFVWKEVKSTAVLLLSLAATLSIIFGIIEEGLQYGWTDGVVLLIGIVLHVLICSIHKYRIEQRDQNKFQNQQAEEVSVKELYVIRGGETKDISESDLVYGDLLLLKKGCQVLADGLFVAGEELELDYGSGSYIVNKQKPFLSYGERVVKGDARMVVTSTNMMMRKATCDPNMRFRILEAHLDKLNIHIQYILIIISILISLVLFLRFIFGKIDDENLNKPEQGAEPSGIRSFSSTIIKIIKESKYTTKALVRLLSVLLVGLTEGVPFVVSLAIVYWNNQNLSANATKQDSNSISKVAAVTTICTNTFGEFTDDDMEVQRVVIGGEFISDCRTLSHNVFEALCDGTGTSKENAKYKFGLNMKRMNQRQQQHSKESEEMILHLTGPLNEIMSKCTHYYDIQGGQVSMSDAVRKDFYQTNDNMECEHKLTTVAVACKHTDNQTQVAEVWVLVALLGLKNKNKEAAKEEVKACRKRGIKIVIVSSKKLEVLKDIALQYGLTADPQSLVLTGEDFRKYTDKERLENVDNISVLGEATSSDKLLLVETLRENGRVVVFLGQRADDAPALIRADIGIAMGRESSEKARESSDIILWEGSFSEIRKMVDFGKCIYHNTQSFLQLVLITTISSTLINLIQTAVWGNASLTIVQSLWANSAVIFLGGFALLTKAPADNPVSFVPIICGRSLITAQMTRNILLQVSYQVTCLVIVQTKGSGTMVFNIFVTCQFFNLFNARELQKKNFFRCIHQHKEFWFSVTVFMVLHATFVAVLDILGFGARLSWKSWAGSVVAGSLSWLVDWLGKCISWLIIMKLVKISQHMAFINC